jgi:ribosomal protein L11 methyltransferase
VTAPAAVADLALVEASEALGCGCMEATGPGGDAVLDFWVPAPGPDPRELEARLAGRGVPAHVAARPQDDGWRRPADFHRPVEIAGRLLVRPPWSPARPPLLDVVVDPGMAFGTGQHATTRSCLELLAGLAAEAPGASALDAGCGSGVLAIAARRLGLDPVWALDADPLCVEATLANARRNGVGLRVARRAIGADRLPAPTWCYNHGPLVAPAPARCLSPPATDRLGKRPRR